MPRKGKTAKSPFAKACAVALSLALVVTMCPIVGFAEDSSRVDAVASEDVQAALLPVSDSEVDVPDDALSVSSNILLDGASVSDEEVPDEDASDRSTVSSDDADVAEGAEDSQPQKRPQNQAPTRLRAAWMPRTLPRWTTMNAKTTPSWTSRSYGRRPPLAPVRRCG